MAERVVDSCVGVVVEPSFAAHLAIALLSSTIIGGGVVVGLTPNNPNRENPCAPTTNNKGSRYIKVIVSTVQITNRSQRIFIQMTSSSLKLKS
jgi:hypothetical protein